MNKTSERHSTQPLTVDIEKLSAMLSCGHANIDVTMQVYNHITDISRVEKEISKLDAVANG